MRCSPKRRGCRDSTVRKCRSRTTTPSACVKIPRASRARFGRCRPILRALSAPTRAPRKMSGVAASSCLFGRAQQGVGTGGLPQRRHRLSRMQAAGDRRNSRGTEPDPRTRGALSPGPDGRPAHHRRRCREGAETRAGNVAGRSARDGPRLLLIDAARIPSPCTSHPKHMLLARPRRSTTTPCSRTSESL